MPEELQGLLKLLEEGRELQKQNQAAFANSDFDYWIKRVSDFLLKHASKKRASEWQALPDSPLISASHHEDEQKWVLFRGTVRERMHWLRRLTSELTPKAEQLPSVIKSVHLDPDLYARCLPLVDANPNNPKVWDSAVRTAGVVLEERLRVVGNVRDGSVGRDLVNKIFGKAGTLAKYFTEESEREGYRDLFAGVVGAFRNPSAHRLIDPNPEEGGAYIVFVNLLLKHLARFTQPGPTTREAFLAACGDDAAPFFAEVLNEASERQLKVSFGGKGFSVRVPKRPAFFYCFPPGANGRATSDIELFLEPVRDPALHEKMRSSFLAVEGTKPSGDYTIRLPVSTVTLPQAKQLFQEVLTFMDEQRLSDR